jgi:hypothetical protein
MKEAPELITVKLLPRSIKKLIRLHLQAIRNYDIASTSGHRFPADVKYARNEALEEMFCLIHQLDEQGIDPWELISEVFNIYFQSDYEHMKDQLGFPIDIEEELPF